LARQCSRAGKRYFKRCDLSERRVHRCGRLTCALAEAAARRTAGIADWRPLPLEEVRRIHIERVLETCKGNQIRAAQLLGIGRTSFYRFLKRTRKQADALTASA